MHDDDDGHDVIKFSKDRKSDAINMGKTGEATSLWRPLLVLLSLSGWARGRKHISSRAI